VQMDEENVWETFSLFPSQKTVNQQRLQNGAEEVRSAALNEPFEILNCRLPGTLSNASYSLIIFERKRN